MAIAPDSSTQRSRHLPVHVGLIMDGNRRWARAHGERGTSFGHQAGAEHLSNVLSWLAARGIDHVSAFVLSADNIRKRGRLEVEFLFSLIEHVIPERVRATERWSLHVSGDLDLLPESTRTALAEMIDETRGRPGHLTLAIGYDARDDILAAVRKTITGGSEMLTVDAVTQNLAGGPVKDIDLIIRTGGDSRISGFFPWQSKMAELYVVEHPWPDLTDSDLDDALAFYSGR
ncbi:polyprenyl diphosphate synthase [Brachybacterium hainanense]|uniref:Polyprenyl diphosphate synthase n=1 Tax=Brachybacterium hainanense TaxID=1541174 RepID=A0ABV6RAM9_9MICO